MFTKLFKPAPEEGLLLSCFANTNFASHAPRVRAAKFVRIGHIKIYLIGSIRKELKVLYHSTLLSGGVQKGGVEEDGFANYYGPGRDRKQTNHPAVSIPLSIYHTFVSMANRVE